MFYLHYILYPLHFLNPIFELPPAPVVYEQIIEVRQVKPVAKPVVKPVVKPQPKTTAQVVAPAPPLHPVLARINQTRAELNLRPLRHMPVLNTSAQQKCQHMITHDYWAHSGAGKDWFSFVQAQTEYDQAGEILAKAYFNLEEQHQGWLNSPLHYDAIVGQFTHFGVGTCVYPDTSPLTVVHFIR